MSALYQVVRLHREGPVLVDEMDDEDAAIGYAQHLHGLGDSRVQVRYLDEQVWPEPEEGPGEDGQVGAQNRAQGPDDLGVGSGVQNAAQGPPCAIPAPEPRWVAVRDDDLSTVDRRELGPVAAEVAMRETLRLRETTGQGWALYRVSPVGGWSRTWPPAAR